MQDFAAVCIYGKDARGNVKPHALRLVSNAQGTSLTPLLVAPPNMAEPTVELADDAATADGGGDDDTAAEGGSRQTEHGFWSAKPIWSSESGSTGTVSNRDQRCYLSRIHSSMPCAVAQSRCTKL